MKEVFRKSKKIFDFRIARCDVYYMNSKTEEKRHFHRGLEFVYVLSGNCQTHKKGKIYVYRSGQPHGVINDSNEEIVFLCMQIPPENEKNTFLV